MPLFAYSFFTLCASVLHGESLLQSMVEAEEAREETEAARHQRQSLQDTLLDMKEEIQGF